MIRACTADQLQKFKQLMSYFREEADGVKGTCIDVQSTACCEGTISLPLPCA